MGSIIYELKEHLNHPCYVWPESLVRYPLVFKPEEAHWSSFVLKDEAGHSLPMQIIDQELEAGFLLRGQLCFLTGLQQGETKRYVLEYDRAIVEAGPQSGLRREEGLTRKTSGEESDGTAGNGRLVWSFPALSVSGERIEQGKSPDGIPIFELHTAEGKRLASAYMKTRLPLHAFQRIALAAGPVVWEQTLQFVFAGGACYTLLLRMTAGMEYIELEETMSGFRAGDEACLRMDWQGLRPARRYVRNRGIEEADAYLDPSGELPFRIVPYDSMKSWHRCESAAFMDDEQRLAAGIFTGDAMKWDDGEYALWRSSDTLAVRLYWRKSGMMWEYPLNNGTRATAMAVYESPLDPDRQESPDTEMSAPEQADAESYINSLYLWHTLIPLDKVKDWVLEWEEPQESYPRLFDRGALPQTMDWGYFRLRRQPVPSDMEEVLDKLSYSFNHVLDTGPVTSREFASWVPLADLTAAMMSPGQFKRCMAASAFMAYLREDENVLPVQTMLGGHPNFLADIKAVPGLVAALFPHHPHAGRWTGHFAKAAALNLKYHTRPPVRSWGAAGGRWTENLGCYVWAALVPLVRTAWALRKAHHADALLHPKLSLLGRWLLESLSAPLAGSRSYPPQGAHSGGHHDPFHPPYILRVLGELLMSYDPLLGEGLLAVCPADAPGFEDKGGGDIWRQMLHGGGYSGNRGTRPELGSVKHTGYGFILRAAVDTAEELSIHLQQIDEGPNYRWGRSGCGGNGVIYYYAGGKRYSYNRAEDVGDDNMGDTEGCTSFGVLVGHEYRSIGRHDLTEPLYDFGFAQFAELLGGSRSSPFYRSRSVLVSGQDYMVVYDEVADQRVKGRFSWFVHKDDPFPAIHQLKPGAAATEVALGGPVDGPPVPPNTYAKPQYAYGYPDGAKGRYYDGYGHFLTLVSHRREGQSCLSGVQSTSYGAMVNAGGRTDHIFRNAAEIHYRSGHLRFDGYAGIIRCSGEREIETALFKGSCIGAGGIVLELSLEQRCEREEAGEGAARGAGGISFTWTGEVLRGRSYALSRQLVRLTLPAACSGGEFRLYVDGAEAGSSRPGPCTVAFTLPAGGCSWEWTNQSPLPGRPEILGTRVSSGKVDVVWRAVAGADGYQAAASLDNGRSWEPVIRDVPASSGRSGLLHYSLEGLVNGSKLHIRVRSVNGAAPGAWSAAYPVYVTAEPPSAPEGLRLERSEGGIRAVWGMLLGVDMYRLYRREAGGGSFSLIYEGPEREFFDPEAGAGGGASRVYGYSVAAVNGNGEGPASLEQTTLRGGLLDWDPKPEETFRRYWRSHEYGYSGFDYWGNAEKGCLPPYP